VERWVDAIELVIGSSSVIFACGAARLGLRTAFAGVVGDDALGRFMLAAMAERGLETSAIRIDPHVPTGASVILSGPSDRAILTAPGTTPLLRVADVPGALVARARHVHVGSVFLLDAARPDLPGFFAAARAAGATTSLDCNWDPREAWDGGIRALLAETDVFLPNAAEAARIAGVDDVEVAARTLATLGPRVVAVEAGAEGALAVYGRGRQRLVPLLPSTRSTRPGPVDLFDAGFACWLAGRPLEACLALGAACGSLATRGLGGTAAQPTLAQAEAGARRPACPRERGHAPGPRPASRLAPRQRRHRQDGRRRPSRPGEIHRPEMLLPSARRKALNVARAARTLGLAASVVAVPRSGGD
jgi:sugar/nucleoside kinase (ribokinase family)